ncbi:MAG: SGNH/GDSL hydrolase family protein [Planctomycetota bacterium]
MARPLKRKLAYFLLLVMAPLAMAEGLVRLSGKAPKLLDLPFFEEAEGLPYLHRRNHELRGHNSTGEFELEARVNSRGFFDTEWVLPKPAGLRRILMLGDSFTGGTGRKGARFYVNEVEKLLRERWGAEKVECVNFGVGGYFTQVERRLLELRGWELEPDAVVLNFTIGDIIDTYRGVEAIRLSHTGLLRAKHEEALGPVGTRLFIHSHALRWLLKQVVLNRQGFIMGDNLAEAYLPNGLHEPQWQDVLAEIEKVHALCKERKLPFFLVYIPQYPAWLPGQDHPDKRLAAWAADKGFPYIRVLDSIRELAQSGAVVSYPKDGHYTDEGEAVLSKAVAGALEESLGSLWFPR